MTKDATGGESAARATGKWISTDPERHGDELGGRTYSIPFDRVWRAALAVAADRDWTVTSDDGTEGRIVAEALSPIRRKTDDIEIRIGLDDDGQTRVDMSAGPRQGRFDLGRNRRRIRRLIRGLDQALADPDPKPSSTSDLPVVLLLAGTVMAAAACSAPAPEPEASAEDSVAAAAGSGNVLERTYERALFFQATDTDSTLAVGWLFEHESWDDRVDRRTRGWLLRGSEWDAFFDSSETTPPSEAPWRLLPAGPLRLVVGEQDQIDRIRFEDGSRLMDFRIEEPGGQWSGARGGTFLILGGAIVLGEQRFEGRILDLSRALRPDEGAPGDWAFLLSGDSLAVVLQAPLQTREVDGFEGWALMGETEIRWPEVTVDWAESRPFDRARRDVPVSWTMRSAEGELTGVLEVRSAQLEPGRGDGPLLPVDGLFQVGGALVIDGASFPVSGLIRHQQGQPPA